MGVSKLFPRRRIIMLAAAVMSAFSFTGCAFNSSVESLLKAPMMNSEQESIYNALVYYTGEDIKLIYPKGGEYRSAYIMQDLDGDDEQEAVVFYELTKSSGADAEGFVRVNIIDRDSTGEWRSFYDHAGAGTTVERVLFNNFGNAGKTRMIIGYGYLTPTEKTMRIYSYTDGLLSTEYSAVYYKTVITDMNRDGSSDMLVINCNNENHQAYAELLSDVDGVVSCIADVKLSPDTVDLPNVVSGCIGNIEDGIQAVFIDGLLSSGYLSTEVLYWVDGVLRNPANIDGSELTALTTRASGLYSMDIDGDGIVEIPTTEPFPGYESSASAENMTLWNVFENYDVEGKYLSLTSASDGYCFILPVRWEGLVTVKTDSTTGEKVFYKFNSNLRESRLELMRIRTVDASEESEYMEKGYFTAAADEQHCFMVLLGDTDDSLLLTTSEVINNFYLL